MKEKLLSLALALVMCLSLCVPAFAVDLPNLMDFNASLDSTSTPQDEYYVQDFISQNEVAHKIEFSEDALPENDVNSLTADSESYEEEQKELAKAHNIGAVQQAREFVQSLNLADSGYGYIEDSCLEELDGYMAMEDAKLTSYTVYTPKTAPTMRSSPSASDMTYFGSYNSRDFYFFYPSSAGVQSNIQKQSTQSQLQNWVKNVIGCTLQFDDVTQNVAWSVFQLLMGAPTNYTVHNSAFTESYCNLTTYTRGIYTLGGNNTYQLLTSQQFCSVYPYMVFHPVDSPKYNGAYPKDFGYQGQAFSPKYKYSTAALCQEAWQVFYGAVSFNKFDTINSSAFKTFWR